MFARFAFCSVTISGSCEVYQQRFCKEAILWLRLRHKIIVPLLGVDMTLFPFCLISMWMEYGDIARYLSRFPKEDRLRLVRLSSSLPRVFLHEVFSSSSTSQKGSRMCMAKVWCTVT